jgi:hypothetical protein
VEVAVEVEEEAEEEDGWGEGRMTDRPGCGVIKRRRRHGRRMRRMQGRPRLMPCHPARSAVSRCRFARAPNTLAAHLDDGFAHPPTLQTLKPTSKPVHPTPDAPKAKASALNPSLNP